VELEERAAQPSGQAAIVKKARIFRPACSKNLPHEALVQHPVERHRMVANHAGGDPVLQFLEHDRGDAGHVELTSLRDRQPDEFDEFLIRPDKAVYPTRYSGDVRREETTIET